jgi:hypothetical protein
MALENRTAFKIRYRCGAPAVVCSNSARSSARTKLVIVAVVMLVTCNVRWILQSIMDYPKMQNQQAPRDSWYTSNHVSDLDDSNVHAWYSCSPKGIPIRFLCAQTEMAR